MSLAVRSSFTKDWQDLDADSSDDDDTRARKAASAAALREELQQGLQWGATAPETLELESGYQGAAYVRVTTSRPDFVLQQLMPVAQRLGARAYFGVHEVDELALAVRRLMADVREVRV